MKFVIQMMGRKFIVQFSICRFSVKHGFMDLVQYVVDEVLVYQY